MPGDNPAQPYPACDESRGALDGTLKKGLLLREAVSIALGLFSDKGGPSSFSRGSQWFSGVRGWSRWVRSQNAAAELPPEQRYRYQ